MTLVLVTFLFSLAYAQKAAIEIGHIGYGEIQKQAVFSIHNTGDVLLTNISLYVDGKLSKQLNAALAPKQGIEVLLNLHAGQHTVEVRTAQNAKNTVSLNVAETVKVEEKTSPQSILTQYQQQLTAVIILILVGVVAFVLLKKPKL